MIGFDDTAQAQFAAPPLTSVRQSPAELGRVAIGLLLDQIERGIAPPQLTTVPTELIIRQSSTAMQRFPPESADSDRYRGMDWQDQLARDLAQQTIFPVPLDPDTAAEQVWPGVGTLVASLAVAVDGCGQQEMQPGIWESIPGFQRGVAMTPIVELLRRAGVQRIDGADRGAVERLTRWLVVRQEEVTDRQLAENINQTERDRQIFDRENNLLIQLGSTNANPRLIDWMDRSQADWGMLGLWRDSRALDLASIYVRDSGTTLTDVEVAPERFPPIELLPASMRDSLEYLIKVAPLANAGRQWGYLVYAERFFWTFNDTVSNRNAYITAALEREELLSSLTERQATLQEAYDRERHLADTIRELGCPIIPLLKGVLLVPLVGAIDPARAAEIVERVLQGVAAEQAQHVLLDITGVPLVDTQVAAALIQTAQAVGLLGAKMTLVGVRPEIAQSIVGLGVDLGIMETRPTLAAALQGLIRR